MKTVFISILCLACINLFSEQAGEKIIKTEANEVTVFLKGAQITSKKKIELPTGTTILKFTELSPFIDPKSIQVKAEGDITILAVNHQQNYFNKSQNSAELSTLEKSLSEIEDKIKLENAYLAVIKEDLQFLQENRNIGGRDDQVSISNLQQASDFYNDKMTSLKLKEIERNKNIEELNRQKSKFEDQIQTISVRKEFPTGEIIVKVDAKHTDSYSFELNYIVDNAGWYPSYDIRAKNINEPVEIIYKANVMQDTKMDWNNVKLRFSSSNPNVSGVAPELQTYFLNYNILPPEYNLVPASIKGKITDASTGEALPGATILVEGSTIGTVTDMNGNYAITMPNGANQLTISYIGYTTQTLPVTATVMNVALEQDVVSLQEVVVVGYGTQRKSKVESKTPGLTVHQSAAAPVKSNNLVNQVEKQTTVDFEIKTPYSIKSENKNTSVEMARYDLPASYQYYCVPKIDKDAFLIANLIDWEKYNLLEGEANLFFEGTYVGKTLMDVRYASDTLKISLGRDKKISVNREKIKDFSSKQFIGNKKEEIRDWKTTVKNNKNEPVNLVIVDQVPVSTSEEIEVSVDNTSDARYKTENGEIKWEFILQPGASKDLELKYSVKYPKYKNLVIE
jgi:hypothetical protein